MKLFNVQDSDRPMFVVAKDWQHALTMWRRKIVEENPGDWDNDPPQPEGIQMVAEDNDLLLPLVPIERSAVDALDSPL